MKVICRGKIIDLALLLLYVRPDNWTDTLVNGIRDTVNGDNIPCREEDFWCPIIDIDEGIIVNWRKGTTASVHYRLPYGIIYDVTDEGGEIIVDNSISSVPSTLCIGTSENRDTIIMDIDENGVIKDWKFNVSEFVD